MGVDEDGRTESWAQLHPRNASKAHMEQLFLKTEAGRKAILQPRL